MIDDPHRIASLEALERLYGEVGEASIAKEIDHLTPHYRAFVEASPFASLATSGPEGLDCSPRGDGPGFVRVRDERTLLIPDRRGNNRIDSLRNILRDPRVALLFLVPGVGETLRVNGSATLTADPALTASFAVAGRAPRLVVVVAVEAVYFQCSRAIVRADLWNPARHLPRTALPSTGAMLAELSARRIDGDAYDAALPQRVKASLY